MIACSRCGAVPIVGLPYCNDCLTQGRLEGEAHTARLEAGDMSARALNSVQRAIRNGARRRQLPNSRGDDIA